MQSYKTNNMQNRKTNVCSRLFNWLYCLTSVACAVLGPAFCTPIKRPTARSTPCV